jgi:hypothetical protein
MVYDDLLVCQHCGTPIVKGDDGFWEHDALGGIISATQEIHFGSDQYLLDYEE